MTLVKEQRPARMRRDDQSPYMPGQKAKKRGEVPTGQHRNDDYGKGRQSGVVAGDKNRPKEKKP